MTDQGFGRRDFLKTAVAGGAAAAATPTSSRPKALEVPAGLVLRADKVIE